MIDEDFNPAGLTLPPKVQGAVSGHLVMKVDEVLWARKPPGDVSAVVLWWGGKEPTTFRPTDLTLDHTTRLQNSVVYEIRTSLSLFEKYLEKCGSLEIAVADKYGMPIGCASVPNLALMTQRSPYQNYYPIINNFGNRIGDLHVSFNLRMLPSLEKKDTLSKTPNNQGAKVKTLKRLSAGKTNHIPGNQSSKENKTRKNEEILERFQHSQPTQQSLTDPRCGPVHDKWYDRRTGSTVDQEHCTFKEMFGDDLSRRDKSPTSNIISQILEHGTKLRDAMTASVMEDGRLPVNWEKVNFVNNESIVFQAVNSGKVKAGNGLSLNHKTSNESPPFSNDSCPINLNSEVEKRIQEYLSGYPMSEEAQQEALSALRTFSPTQETLTAAAFNLLGETSDTCRTYFDGEKSKENGGVMNGNQNMASKTETPCEVDSQVLSHINCVRITIYGLVINSVGVKRIGSFSQKKSGSSKSNIAVHPPGITYFVEYTFPPGSSSPRWQSNVRFCSKRILGYEVQFEKRSIHNFSTTSRSSASTQETLAPFISSISFKVSARHLHQRVPVTLGSVALDTVKPLFKSVNLRYVYDLPVIAPDNLPVAQLKFCLELGRDRVHFGGVLDPENNSLGITSPHSASHVSKTQMYLTSKSHVTKESKTRGKTLATVTRNIAHTSSLLARKENFEIPKHQSAQADRMIKQLNAGTKASSKSQKPPQSPSILLTPRLEAVSKTQGLNQKRSSKSTSVGKPLVAESKTLKHEIALTFLQISDHPSLKSKSLFISYKFPIHSVTQDNTAKWLHFEAEPSGSSDITSQRSHSNIHSLTLHKSDSIAIFLEKTFKLKGMVKDNKASIVFTLCNQRKSGTDHDSQVATVYLPLTCLSTIIDAYFKASKGNPSFPPSLCSSAILDLPAYLHSQKGMVEKGLKLKVDYRHLVVGGNSKEENSLCSPVNVSGYCTSSNDRKGLSERRGKADSKLELPPSNSHCNTFAFVPNWARSPDKKLPSSCDSSYFSPCVEVLSNKDYVACPDEISSAPLHDPSQFCTKKMESVKKLQAGYEPVNERCYLPAEQLLVSSHLDGAPNTFRSHSLSNLASSVDGFGDGHHSHDTAKNSRIISSPSLSSLDSHPDFCSNQHPQSDNMTASELAHLSEPPHLQRCEKCSGIHHASKVAEQIKSYEDKSLQVSTKTRTEASQTSPEKQNEVLDMDFRARTEQQTLKTINEGCQTSPRESQKIVKKDVEISTNLADFESKSDMFQKEHCTNSQVVPKASVDDVEVIDIESINESQKFTSGVRCNSSKGLMSKERKGAPVCDNGDITEGIVHCVSSEPSKSMLPSFKAKVGVECALHLQHADTPEDSRNLAGRYFVFVSFQPCEIESPISSDVVAKHSFVSPAVVSDGEPEWYWHSDVHLPVDLLYSATKRMVFKIWQVEEITESLSLLDMESKKLIGFSILDVTVLGAGLPLISGWFNIMDFAGACRGQIKLCIEPLEDISRVFSLVGPIGRNLHSNSPPAFYVAHCVYPEFPSHVTQFSDIVVRKVDPQSPTEAITNIVSDCQSAIMQQNQEEIVTSLSKKEENVKFSLSNEILKVVGGKNMNSEHSQSAEHKHCKDCSIGVLISPTEGLKTRSQDSSEPRTLKSDYATSIDPSLVLRKRLFELEEFMKTIKGKQSTKKEKPFISSENTSEVCLSRKCSQSTKSANAFSEDNQEMHSETERLCSDVEELLLSSSSEEQKAPSHKQRKMWEKPDLIDLETFQISCRDGEKSTSQIGDVGEWLTESALQQVFSPLLFNDILNNMNPSHGVHVIELEENSDDCNDSAAAACSSSHGLDFVRTSAESNQEANVCGKDHDRHSKKGNETYRKDVPYVLPSELCPPWHTNRSGLSAGDADSGVDVDVSSNFYSGSQRSNCGRDQSSSSSLTSSQHPSNWPSSLSASASATPADSPQHISHHHVHCVKNSCHQRNPLAKRSAAAECQKSNKPYENI